MRQIKASSYRKQPPEQPGVANWLIAHHDPTGFRRWGFFCRWGDEPDGHHSRHYWTDSLSSHDDARAYSRDEAELELALLRVAIPDAFLYLVPAPVK